MAFDYSWRRTTTRGAVGRELARMLSLTWLARGSDGSVGGQRGRSPLSTQFDGSDAVAAFHGSMQSFPLQTDEPSNQSTEPDFEPMLYLVL